MLSALGLPSFNGGVGVWVILSMMSLGRSLGGSALLYVCCVLASAGGIGGGGLNVPVLLVIMGYDYKEAVSLSLATVLGNTLAQVGINWNKRHPKDITRPLVYWNAILVLLPCQLGGTSIGVFVLSAFPATLLVLLAMAVLLFASTKTFLKGLKLYKQESIQLQIMTPRKYTYSDGSIPADDNVFTKTTSISLTHSNNSFFTSTNPLLEINDSDDKISPLNDKLIERSRPEQVEHYDDINMHVPYRIILTIAAAWTVYAGLSIALLQGTEKCSRSYFVVLTIAYLPLTILTWNSVHYLNQQQRDDPGSILEGDIPFTNLGVLGYSSPTLAFVIGILSSLLGIGGGELMGPLLLTLRVLPQVTSATTSMMSFIATSSTVLRLGVGGDLPFPWAAYTFVIGLAGGLTGRYGALYITAKYGRASVTVFMLSSVLAASFFLLIYKLATEEPIFSFNALC